MSDHEQVPLEEINRNTLPVVRLPVKPKKPFQEMSNGEMAEFIRFDRSWTRIPVEPDQIPVLQKIQAEFQFRADTGRNNTALGCFDFTWAAVKPSRLDEQHPTVDSGVMIVFRHRGTGRGNRVDARRRNGKLHTHVGTVTVMFDAAGVDG